MEHTGQPKVPEALSSRLTAPQLSVHTPRPAGPGLVCPPLNIHISRQAGPCASCLLREPFPRGRDSFLPLTTDTELLRVSHYSSASEAH